MSLECKRWTLFNVKMISALFINTYRLSNLCFITFFDREFLYAALHRSLLTRYFRISEVKYHNS